MGKMMNSWSGMRKYLEGDMLADSLKGRVRWNCTSFVGMDGAAVFEIYVDDMLAKRFSMETVAYAACGPKKHGERWDMKLFWENYWAQKKMPMEERCEFDDEDFALALAEYRCLGAQEAIFSDDPVVRLFAVLDRRVGKGVLEKIAGEVERQPEWIRPFYRLRIDAEQKITR